MRLTKALIVEKVKEKQGCKVMDLAGDKDIALAVVQDSDGKSYKLWNAIEELISEGKLIEIEYILSTSDRIKSFLLPANTDIKIKSGETILDLESR